MESASMPIGFVPKNYIRQRKHWLYNNLVILLSGLWALTISQDMDVFESEARSKLKYILSSISLILSHLVIVPSILIKLSLHYSIVLGAIGMCVTSFLHFLTDPTTLSIVISLRQIFVALFDVSATIYIVQLARTCTRMQGNALYNEILTMRIFIAVFSSSESLASSVWHRYTKEDRKISREVTHCGINFCPQKMEKLRSLIAIDNGQNTIQVALMIIIALSGTILIAMYLRPIESLSNENSSERVVKSDPLRVFVQLAKPNAKSLALLIASCVFLQGIIDEFVFAYVTCSLASDLKIFVNSMKEISWIFGVMTCVTIVDFLGFYCLYGATLFVQFFTYLCLAFWKSDPFENPLFYLIVHHALCMSTGIQVSLLQLFVVETLGDEEISAWCFFYVLGDFVHLFQNILHVYLCTAMKLWILMALSPITLIMVIIHGHGKANQNVSNIYESCSLVVKTPKRTLEKSVAFDLKIIVEKWENIRKVETQLQRTLTLKSGYSQLPVDDVSLEITL